MREFHRSFMPELVLVGLVTIVSMYYVHIFMPHIYSLAQKNKEYTTIKSQINVDCEKIQSIRPSSE